MTHHIVMLVRNDGPLSAASRSVAIATTGTDLDVLISEAIRIRKEWTSKYDEQYLILIGTATDQIVERPSYTTVPL